MDEGGESSSSHQVYPDEVYAPVTPKNPGQPEPNMICNNWLENPFVEAILEETSVKKSFAYYQSDLGSTSRIYDESGGMYNRFSKDNYETWQNMSCMNLLSLADATISNGAGGSGGGGGGGGAFLNDLKFPPQTVTEPWLNTGLSLQFTLVTPDQAKRADQNKQVESNEDGRTNLNLNLNLNHDEQSRAEVSTLVEGNQDLEKGMTGQSNLNETPQAKEKRRKHRPKVVTEGKPKRQRKPATPKKPETPNPNGTSTGKRKYVRKKVIEKPTETPVVEEQTKKSCKRKIDFNEPEQETEVVVEKTQVEHVIDLTCSSSEVVENCQKVNQSESTSPITPSKSEIPQGRSKKDYTKARCKINFSQETHDKGLVSDPSPNQSNCSTSASFNKREEEPNGFESLESFLSMFTDYSSGGKQGIQLPALYKKKPEMPKETGVRNKQQSNRYKASGYLKITKKKKPEPFTLGNESTSHQQNFQLSIANKNQKNKKPMMPSLYHGHQFTNYIGFHPSIIYSIDALINQFERLNINGRMREQDRVAIVQYMSGYHENNALVAYQQGGSMVPYEGLFNPMKRRKPRAKVDLDNETERVWRLLLEDINSQGIDGTDEEKAKWWEEERKVFRGRANSFIARMHLVQGDRRFSKWKGSVLDSVVGVFLTQNVSDHLSSSAFMSLAAKYPLKSNSSSEPIHEEEPILSFKEPCHVDEDDGPMMLQEADSFDKKEVVSSKDFSKNSVGIVDLNDNSECEVQELSEKDQIEIDELVSSQNSADTSPSSVQSSVANNTERLNPCSMHTSVEKQKEVGKDSVLGGYTSFVELLHMQGATTVHERTIIQKNSEKCVSEESGISVESTSQTIVKTISSQESANNNCEVQEVIDLTNVSTKTSKASESSKIVEASGETVQKVVDFNVVDKVRKEKTGKKQTKVDWDKIRLQAEVEQKREKSQDTMDKLDYEALRNADVSEVADAIKERGMNNVLAARIKAMLERLVQDHGSTDLEWLRDVPPDKAKEYLLSFRGLGLKSVECIRLLTLHHLAFPVDTNVGRIAVRLGWVPLQSLPESLQLHLLELYPIQESIQKYLWPRLCKLDQRTLYELHYQMITFGKVFCTKTKPNCNACPLRGECRHFASAFASARLGLPAPEESKSSTTENKTSQGQLTLPPAREELQPLSEVEKCISVIEKPTTPHGPIVEMPASPEPIVEMPASPKPIIEVPATPEPEQMQYKELDIEDFCEDSEEIPMIKLNIEEFTQNLQTFMERHMELGEGDVSKALVAITSEAASIPTPKLKNVSQLRTEHQVYELPDSHPLLEGLDTREPDDPCSYLLAIWTPGETADSMQPPEGQCSSQESGILCNEETCFFCSSTREANAQTVRGTLLIPCRTAMRGSFPLNGTYFQVNEVFADHESSLNPIDVPRSWLWNLPRRMVYFGTSIPTIFKGLTTEDIQYCFWRGFVCVRGFDQKTRAPRPLMARLHFPASKLKRPNAKIDEKEKLTQPL